MCGLPGSTGFMPRAYKFKTLKTKALLAKYVLGPAVSFPSGYFLTALDSQIPS